MVLSNEKVNLPGCQVVADSILLAHHEERKETLFVYLLFPKHHVENVTCSVTSDSFVTPWTIAHQAPLILGILQAKILEWVVMPSSRGSSQPRSQTQVSHIADGFFTI